MVGLPDASVRESRDRIRSAIRNSGFEFPPHRITVNLAPADVRKAGSSFDLPIALGVLAASGRSRGATSTTCCCSASCRSTAASSRRAACCRSRRRRAANGYRGLLLPPRQSRAKRRSSTGFNSTASARSREAVGALNDPDAFTPAAAARADCRHAGHRRRRRLRRRPRAGAGAPRAGDRRRRRPQHAADRPAGRGQDHDGEAARRRSCRR